MCIRDRSRRPRPTANWSTKAAALAPRPMAPEGPRGGEPERRGRRCRWGGPREGRGRGGRGRG
eukprot:5093167-Pyramimonas_sp.AAC.1